MFIIYIKEGARRVLILSVLQLSHKSNICAALVTMVSLHPLIGSGYKGTTDHAGGKLYCHCGDAPVEVTLSSNVAFNHACGCSKCWKPADALFSIVGVVPREKLAVTANESKLRIVDPNAAIQRNACKECGVHMFGRIEVDHAFKGLDFVHTELSKGGGKDGWQEPQFAAFVSSIIEQGFNPDGMAEVRGGFKHAGLESYDCLSPTLMDLLAAFTAKKAGTFKSKV
ncbi:S-glutathione synthase [Nemania sp. NC0429]|nr:S-glutathione synthase [Nemania sp. NC0429]